MDKKTVKITKRVIDQLKPDGKDQYLWDSELKGFGVRVKPSGAISYIIQYRNQYGRSRRLTVGAHGVLTPDEAKQLARENLVDVKRGSDPATESTRMRKLATIKDLTERYLKEHARPNKKRSSVEEDERLIRIQVLPRFGALKVEAVTREEIIKFMESMKESIYTANRTRSLLSKMFNLAELWGWRRENSNPCRLVPKYKEKIRDRFLKADEIQKLLHVLDSGVQDGTIPNKMASMIRLLLFTGCRVSEVLNLRWDNINHQNKTAHLDDSKTGAKVVYLNDSALSIIKGQPKTSPYIFPSDIDPKKPTPKVTLNQYWRYITAWEELNWPDVRLHDFRHTFASQAAMKGLSLTIIGALLGHKTPQTTMRYTHFASSVLSDAAGKVGDILGNMACL